MTGTAPGSAFTGRAPRPSAPARRFRTGTEPDGTQFEVLTGPGGPEREPTRGAALRGLWQRPSVRARALTTAATVAALTLVGTVAYAATSSGSGEADTPRERHGHGPWSGFGGGGFHGEATVKDPRH
ncbi:hypothetical protein [Streptomyces bicolor]|uniref:hypothetical protein n=1 Tax=Streptomyces bicolor TaxID=66874 RepID=UPI0004E14087|nr:hypothetical protein [Streptomyces bicolor]